MTSSAVEELLEDGGTQVSDLEETPDQVIEVLTQAARERTQQMWSFYTDLSSHTAPSLTLGLNGDRGALGFWDGRSTYRPAEGSNPDAVDYWWADHHTPFPEYSEVPAQDVLRATREFLQTGQQPTCIKWVAW